MNNIYFLQKVLSETDILDESYFIPGPLTYEYLLSWPSERRWEDCWRTIVNPDTGEITRINNSNVATLGFDYNKYVREIWQFYWDARVSEDWVGVF